MIQEILSSIESPYVVLANLTTYPLAKVATLVLYITYLSIPCGAQLQATCDTDFNVNRVVDFGYLVLFAEAFGNPDTRRTRLHDLRHTCASLLIAQDESPKL